MISGSVDYDAVDLDGTDQYLSAEDRGLSDG